MWPPLTSTLLLAAGVNDTKFTVRSHLGHLLHAGDAVLGFDLTTLVLPDDEAGQLRSAGAEERMPDLVLVRKHYPKWRSKLRERHWTLKRMDAEEEEGAGAEAEAKAARGRRRDDVARGERDFEGFMQELEEDRDMRSRVNLYKNPGFKPAAAAAGAGPGAGGGGMATEDEDEDGAPEEDHPVVGLDELLDSMHLERGPAPTDAAVAATAAVYGNGGSAASALLASKYGASDAAPAYEAVMETLRQVEDRPSLTSEIAARSAAALKAAAEEEEAKRGDARDGSRRSATRPGAALKRKKPSDG